MRNMNDPKEIVTKSNRNSTSAKDINSHELQKLKLGDYVRVQNPRTKVWEDKAKIIRVMKYDRSYLLEDIEDGKVSRKNRRFLKAIQSTELTGQRENSGVGGPEKRDKSVVSKMLKFTKINAKTVSIVIRHQEDQQESQKETKIAF